MKKILAFIPLFLFLEFAYAKEINLECSFWGQADTHIMHISLNTDSSTASKTDDKGRIEAGRLYSSADSYWFTDSTGLRHKIDRTDLSYTSEGVDGFFAGMHMFDGECSVIKSKSII